jgi:ArsR family metal-binding transcriptional regulator
MTGHLLRPCKSTAAFEAIPRPELGKIRLDLQNCLKSLGEVGYEEVCDANVLIILKKKIEVTVYPSGKLILKTDLEYEAKEVMDEIYELILD